MNERILELAEQAGINCVVPTVGTLEYSGKGEIEHLKKFAELLIRECAGLVQGVPTDTMGYHTADQKIKQHFGVE